MNVSKILENFREMSPSKREQGKLFEKFCREWLRLSPEYRDVKDVWLWGDWKYRTGADVGIDLVAETFAGEFWGIQCKFYAEGSVDKAGVDSFLATGSGKDFGGIKFSRLLLFTTTSLTKNAMEAIEDRTPPVTLIRVDHWDDVAIDWDRFWSEFDKKIVSGGDTDARIGAEVLRPKKELRDHQKAALEAVRKGFQTADRGKLVMACGTGK
ncbi:MAG: restriction endonuclease, partial [Thermoguttaceae bacterium]|nr:restriction endonuclease [Thermoguttaceae bacterium]